MQYTSPSEDRVTLTVMEALYGTTVIDIILGASDLGCSFTTNIVNPEDCFTPGKCELVQVLEQGDTNIGDTLIDCWLPQLIHSSGAVDKAALQLLVDHGTSMTEEVSF